MKKTKLQNPALSGYQRLLRKKAPNVQLNGNCYKSLTSPPPPTKNTKKIQPTEDENKQQLPIKKPEKSRLITTDSEDKHEYSICLNKMYEADFFFYADIPFDNGLDKFDGNELEKEALQSAITKQKNKIISKLTDIFGDTSNVKMTFT